ncbi:MAG: LPXTG cell wall anchor domain-containing protein, partial [Bifidobacteriaceae bacterium]|nr:LPXTG cell wall anchor domain-containing protein [Bifidobacteriaceae bacterium]
AIGKSKANENGQVSFTWRIPECTARNVHTVTLRGPQSGPWEARYTVVCAGGPPDIEPPQTPKAPQLPFTGADNVVALTGAALGLLLAGLLLLLAAKRRRRPEADGAAQA